MARRMPRKIPTETKPAAATKEGRANAIKAHKHKGTKKLKKPTKRKKGILDLRRGAPCPSPAGEAAGGEEGGARRRRGRRSQGERRG
jgi:hypothetical protein